MDTIQIIFIAFVAIKLLQFLFFLVLDLLNFSNVKKNTEKTYQELLIEELEALILKKSMEIKEIELIMEKNAHQRFMSEKGGGYFFSKTESA